MNHNEKHFLRDHLNEKRQENMREEAVIKILSDSNVFIPDKNYIFKIVLSPKSYPIYRESLDFNFQEFSDFFFDMTNAVYKYNKNQEHIMLFDPEGWTIKPTDFIQPVPHNEWINKSEHRRFPNSILIKKDGVILFNHAQIIEEAQTTIDLNILYKHLTLFITELVPKIYKKMNYDGKIKILVEYGDLSDYQLIYGNPPLKYDFFPQYEPQKDLILNFENPASVLQRIMAEFQGMFFKLHKDP